jgi:acetyl esterase/lipase
LKRKLVFYAVIFLTSIASVIAVSMNIPTLSINVLHNIPYIEGQTDASHLLDVYLPANRPLFERPRPLIVWIHGGAWLKGNKDATPAAVLPLCGYVAASINYRLTDQAIFPAQLEDCQNAIRFLRRHSAEYGIDPNKIGVWGVSAGGHLAALVGLTGDEEDKKDVTSLQDKNRVEADRRKIPEALRGPRVQAVADWCGPTDFMQIATQAAVGNKFELKSSHGPVATLLGGLPAEKPEKAKLASPVTYVDTDAPPFLIAHGADDDVVPPQQSLEFSKLLTQHSVENHMLIVPHTGHDLSSKDLIDKTIKFFDNILTFGAKN